jgi:hypothetical protein
MLLRIPHAVIGEPDWHASIDNLKVSYLERLQLMSTELEIGVLCCSVGIALRSESNIASIGQEPAVFLHGTGDKARRRRELRQVVGGLQPKADTHLRSSIEAVTKLMRPAEPHIGGSHPWSKTSNQQSRIGLHMIIFHAFLVTFRVLADTFYAQPWQQIPERF